MCIKDLARQWGSTARTESELRAFSLRLSESEAAKIKALSDMYTAGNTEEILSDLVKSALKEIEESFPYVAGETVVGEDEIPPLRRYRTNTAIPCINPKSS